MPSAFDCPATMNAGMQFDEQLLARVCSARLPSWVVEFVDVVAVASSRVPSSCVASSRDPSSGVATLMLARARPRALLASLAGFPASTYVKGGDAPGREREPCRGAPPREAKRDGGLRHPTVGFHNTLSDCQTGALRPSARMSLAVTQCAETADSELTRVVEMRPGWLKTAYAQRGDALAKLNVVEFVDKIGMPAAEQPSEPPMRNYRYYFDMPKFAELRTAAETDPAIDQQIAAEQQAMPAGSCTPSWFLNQYQLKECGLCGTREGKLSICNGCRSFVYCCSEHQAPLAGF